MYANMLTTYVTISKKSFPVKHTKSLRVYNKSNLSREIMRDFISQIASWPNPEQHYADEALFDITDGTFLPMAVTDGNELIAIAAYGIVNGNAYNEIPVVYNPHYTKFIYLSWIAGKGKGGGAIIIKELMQIAESINAPILLEAVNNSDAFYIRADFEKSPLRKGYYYWIPSRVENDFLDDSTLWTDID